MSGYARTFDTSLVLPMSAAQGCDAVYLVAYALLGFSDNEVSGQRMKTALENIPRVYYGVVATYEHPFSSQEHAAITANMLVMGKVQSGAVTFVYPEEAKRNLFVQRKQ